MKKKIFSLFFAASLILTLSSCTEQAQDLDSDNSSNSYEISDNTPAETVNINDIMTSPEESASSSESQSITTPLESKTQPTVTSLISITSTTSVTSLTSTASVTSLTSTASVIPEQTKAPTPTWIETAIGGTLYINTNNVYSRLYAIEGSPTVNRYSLNQQINIIAKTDTGYFKIKDGEYIHRDYLETEKITSPSSPKPPVVTTTTTVGAPVGAYRKPTAAEMAFADRVLELVNNERAKAGCAPFKKLDVLTEIAIIRAFEITSFYSHNRPDNTKFSSLFYEKGLEYSLCGENIAAGQASPEAVVSAWMNSEGHRKNILNPGFEYMGVGYYNISDNKYNHYWVQNFYTPME